MYNKLYTKILDSSIWLEPNPTRIVWITFLAAMDEDGFAQFSSVRNLARRAMVTDEEAIAAVKTLESPDAESASKDHDGRRIERVDGGWMILNAGLYRDIVTRTEKLRLNRERVARHRAKKVCNAIGNAPVMQSEALSESEAKNKKGAKAPPFDPSEVPGLDLKTWEAWVEHRTAIRKSIKPHAMAAAARQLAALGSRQAAEVERAIAGGWQGLHPDARGAPPPPPKRDPPTSAEITAAQRAAAEANRRELARKLNLPGMP